MEENGAHHIYQSEVIHNNLNPEWQPFTIPASDLNHMDLSKARLFVECFDHNNVGSNHLIGSVEVHSFSSFITSNRFHWQSYSMKNTFH